MFFNLRIKNLSFYYVKLVLLLFIGICVLCVNVHGATAQSGSKKGKTQEIEITNNSKNTAKWEHHVSLSDVFSVKFPREYKYKIYPFRFNREDIAFSIEILSSLKGEDDEDEKTFSVKAVQTFGAAINQKQADILLDNIVAKYQKYIEESGGYSLANEDINYHNFPGKKIYYAYFENGKKYVMRVHVYITDYSKVEQILTAPASTIYSYKADSFFDSLKIFNGITKLEKPTAFAKGWKKYTSNNKTFTVKLPPTNMDFTPVPPSFKITPTTEIMHFKIVDPVLEESVFYDIYSYHFKDRVSPDFAKQLLLTRHIKKYIKNVSTNHFSLKSYLDGNVRYMSTRLSIPHPKNIPYLSRLLLKIQYIGNFAIVQEVVSSANHAASGLPDLLLNETLEYHPEKYVAPK